MNRFVCKLILGFLLLAVMAVGAASCGGGSTSSSSASGPATPSSVPIAIEGLDGVSGVDTSSSFQVTFPENVRPDTVNSDTFFIVEYDGTSPNLSKFVKATYDPSNIDTSNKIEADISCAGNVCTLTPRTPLSHGKTYIVVVTTAVQFTSGGYYDGYMATFTTTIAIGGAVTGLVGSGLVLTNAWVGGSEDLTISAVGAFEFTTAFSKDIVYAVTVKTQPNSQICTVASGTGTTGTANITNVAVTCAASTYTVGVTVSGMRGTGLVLQNNGGDDLAITANGAFTFTTPVADGSGYAVAVSTNPTAESCTVTGGTGTISGADVTGIAIACSETAWAKTVSTGSDLSAFYATAVDTSGNIYAVGDITGTGTYTFGSGVTAAGTYGSGQNVVIVKYDWTGTAKWANSVSEGSAHSSFSGVAVDASGNVYAAGSIEGIDVYNFGNGQTATGNAAGSNIVIVKYNSSGLAQWARTVTTGPSSSSFSGVSVDTSGNVYAVGLVVGTNPYNFGDGKTATGAFAINAVIVKYNSSGQTQWVQTAAEGSTSSRFYKVSVNTVGNIYAVGSIDNNTAIVKYLSSGVEEGAKLVTAGTDSEFFGTAVDTSDNIYAVGYLGGTGSYNFGNGHTVAGTYAAGQNAVIVKYNSNDETQWAHTVITGPGTSTFKGVSVDASGNVYAVGYILGAGTYDFGDIGNSKTVAGTYDSGGGGDNVVIVKYNASGETQWARSVIAGTNDSLFQGVSVETTGNAYTVGYMKGTGDFTFGTDVTVHGTYLSDGNAVIVKYIHE